ncbi:pentatricopeptide repeat-containing protein At3g63370, chloroplastic-like isoform X2 [Selaginella moellendorffii]|uniref:pentatricopeptide repeat-containing protein At3g63370, chloroplastic-like isoform X2 n=1 Tax=Selaginella moellendorffii TaxID=88036 RepID=UPI000D1C3FFF|nr:pentatricopeptide repeat-containing protein At3g63370, chloroplastic-like isoform X2 [Selaginella moellendorffii]|eukprot:XP_024538460.1 pentatricopeptide repeat-containing protein At3g63370, chloroplastic-like isoform X2 [Selaginella moellendorffii]
MLDAGSNLDRFEQRSLHLGNKSVSIHGRNGNVAGAREVFDRMPWRSVVSWNSLMLSYAENMRGEIALEIFHRMKIEGGEPDSHSFVAAIKACGSVIDPESMARGLNLHSEAIEIGWDSNTFVATSLIDMYGRWKRLDHAKRVLEAMDPGKRNVVAWNTLILRYAENGDGELALELFDRMRNEESCGPDARTFAAAAKACAAIATTGKFNSEKKIKFIDGELVKRGMEIHELASKRGLDTDTYVGNSLVNMISHRSVVSWNSLLLGYAQSASHSGLALDLLGKMLARGTRGCQPDGRTFVAAARACACLADREGQTRVGDKLMKITSLEQGMFFHSRAATSLHDGELDIFVASSLVDMYMKCGSPQDARHVFDRMPQRSVVSWTVLMAGYVENGEAELALEVFTLMQAEAAEEVVPAAFVPAAKACTVLAAREVPKEVDGRRRPVKMKSLEMGMAIHSRAGEAETDDFLASALIDMYSKCASLVDALKVFDKMVHHDVASWNALILACADNEQDELGLELLRLMQDGGDCAPNSRTFAAALKACGNSLLKCKALTAVLAETFRHTSSGPGPGSDCFLDAALVDACSKCGSMLGAQQDTVVREMPRAFFVSSIRCKTKAYERTRPPLWLSSRHATMPGWSSEARSISARCAQELMNWTTLWPWPSPCLVKER